MTKSDALKIVNINSRGSENFHKAQASQYLATAETLLRDFKAAKTNGKRNSAEFYYLKSLEKADAHLTLIDK